MPTFDRLPTEIQLLVLSLLYPADIRNFLLATGPRYAPLFTLFVDCKESYELAFFANAQGLKPVFLSDVQDYDTLTLGSINLVDITDWLSFHTQSTTLAKRIEGSLNVIVISIGDNFKEYDLDGAPYNECDEMRLDVYPHDGFSINLFLSSVVASSQVLIKGLLSQIPLITDVMGPHAWRVSCSESPFINIITSEKYPPMSITDSKSLYIQPLDEPSIKGYVGSCDSVNTVIVALPRPSSARLDGLTLNSSLVVLDNPSEVTNCTFTGSLLEIRNRDFGFEQEEDDDQFLGPDFKQELQMINNKAPNLEVLAVIYEELFPMFENFSAPKLKSASFGYGRLILRSGDHRIPYNNLDTSLDQDFSFLANVESLEASAFNGPLLNCPSFEKLKTLQAHFAQHFAKEIALPSLEELNITIFGQYDGGLPMFSVPQIKQLSLQIGLEAFEANAHNIDEFVKDGAGGLESCCLFADLTEDKEVLENFIRSAAPSLISLELNGPWPVDLFNDLDFTMENLTSLTLNAPSEGLTLTKFDAPKLKTLAVSMAMWPVDTVTLNNLTTVEQFETPFVRGLDLTAFEQFETPFTSGLNTLSLTGCTKLKKVNCSDLTTLRFDHLPDGGVLEFIGTNVEQLDIQGEFQHRRVQEAGSTTMGSTDQVLLIS